jgi:colanic acid biosynthesis glycosyl transferase WcaI
VTILFLTEYFPPEQNAAASRVFERARLWAAAGHTVTVITGAPNFPQGVVRAGYRNQWRHDERMDGVHVIRVKTFVHPNRGRVRRILDQASFLPTALLTALRTPRPDVVLATSPTLFAACTACATGLLRRVPFVLEIGDLAAASIDAVGALRIRPALSLVQRVERFLYRKAARIVVQTERVRDEVVAVSGRSASAIAVITNGVEASLFRSVAERYTPPAGAPFVAGYVGTMGLAQGLEVILDAADRLRDCPVDFHLVGDGAARPALEAGATGRRLTNVRFSGPYPRPQMPDVWASIHLALVCLRDHPTFRNVVPSKIFEAMACGVPVVLSAPDGEATTLVTRYGIGAVVPPGDAAAMADAIRWLAGSPALLRRQSVNARRAVQLFDRPAQARAYLDLLEAVVAKAEQQG